MVKQGFFPGRWATFTPVFGLRPLLNPTGRANPENHRRVTIKPPNHRADHPWFRFRAIQEQGIRAHQVRQAHDDKIAAR